MKRIFLCCVMLSGALAVLPHGAGATPAGQPRVGLAAATLGVPDSLRLQNELQSLNWKQFRAVVVAIPPIRAEVDKYGSLGWQYVRQNYRTYPWKSSIDRLTDQQKVDLARLIAQARRSG